MSIACIIPYFNFANNPRLVTNHEIQLESLKSQGFKVFTIECCLGDAQPVFSDLSYRTDSIMWYKENLINIAVNLIKNDFDYIMWIDSGILLSDNCLRSIVNSLQTYSIIQCFEYGIFCNQNNDIFHISQPSKGYNTVHQRNTTAGPHGGAYASHASFFDKYNLYQNSIVGSGDTFLYWALSSKINLAEIRMSTSQYADYVRWASTGLSNLKFGYAKNVIFRHLWHTNKMDDKDNRHKILIDHDFNPNVDIVTTDEGLMKWSTTVNPTLRMNVENYMVNR